MLQTKPHGALTEAELKRHRQKMMKAATANLKLTEAQKLLNYLLVEIQKNTVDKNGKYESSLAYVFYWYNSNRVEPMETNFLHDAVCLTIMAANGKMQRKDKRYAALLAAYQVFSRGIEKLPPKEIFYPTSDANPMIVLHCLAEKGIIESSKGKLTTQNFYPVRSFPTHIKKEFIYPKLPDAIRELFKYNVDFYIGDDFNLYLPKYSRSILINAAGEIPLEADTQNPHLKRYILDNRTFVYFTDEVF